MNKQKLLNIRSNISGINFDVNKTSNLFKDAHINHGDVLTKLLNQQKDVLFVFNKLIDVLDSKATKPIVSYNNKTQKRYFDCGKCGEEIEYRDCFCKHCSEEQDWSDMNEPTKSK